MSSSPLKPSIMLILRAPIGGLFRHVVDLTCGLHQRGYKVGIICDKTSLTMRSRQTLESLKPLCAMGVHILEMSRQPSFSDIKIIQKINSLIQKYQPDILHGHGAKGGAYARICARLSKKRAFYTPHGGSLHYTWRSLQGAAFLALEKFLQSKNDHIFFESHYGFNAFKEKLGMPKSSFSVVQNGLSEAEFSLLQKPSNLEYDFLFIGELRKLKGVDLFLQAFSSLVHTRQNLKALIVGSGPDEQEFKNLAQKLSLTSNVVFEAPMDARKAFTLCHIMVMPSRAESLPYIILEAGACAQPMIATDVGGIKEIFGDHQHLLIPPHSVDALFNAMKKSLQDSEALRQNAMNIRAHIHRQFHLEKMVDALAKTYETLSVS